MSVVDKKFTRLLKILLPQVAEQAADALLNRGKYPGTSLGTKDDPAPDVNNPAKIAEFFRLNDADKAYVAAMTSTSSEDIKHDAARIAAKLQSDIMSQLERDYKAQHTGRIRMVALQAARRKFHSEPRGPIFSGIGHGIQSFTGYRG